jgi:hypothetical protein
LRPRAFPRPRLSQGRLNVSIASCLLLARWIVAARRSRVCVVAVGAFSTIGCLCRSTGVLGERLRDERRRVTSSEIQTVCTWRNRTSRFRRIKYAGRLLGCIIFAVPSSLCSFVGCAEVVVLTKYRSIRRAPRGAVVHRLRPEIRRDYPLNLSILISGGKETNQDSLSNGE